jgi:N-acetylneuraminate lyase
MRPFFAGLIAAPFTPFGPAGRLDLDVIPRLAALLAAQGVRGAFVCGTTGEGASMTLEEGMQICAAIPPAERSFDF